MDATTDHLHRIDALLARPAPDIAHLPAHGDLATAHRRLVEALRPRWGSSRNLAAGGFLDPTIDDDSGLSLVAPFAGRLVELCGWAVGERWIGCGIVRDNDGGAPHLVAVTARRADPATAFLPAENGEEGADVAGDRWVRRLAAATGRPQSRQWPVDWSSAETRLGTALPVDYRHLAEHFGPGIFAGFLDLALPSPPLGYEFLCLVEQVLYLAELAAADPGNANLYHPHLLYPAPGGLLQWAGSVQADQFYWLTEGADPNRWPVITRNEDGDSWARFDGSTAEFVHRLITDHRHPFSVAGLIDRPDFNPYEPHEPRA
ncbi:hypothetical protein [Streptomyces sp. XY431]|uniref:hypothetical protein n=1 Tax=Streptomyces sp. XY431 TaxID=1415562 RepID=UPI0006AFE8EF|nr:hypothetical protein [Streptomyces sp. XY431]